MAIAMLFRRLDSVFPQGKAPRKSAAFLVELIIKNKQNPLKLIIKNIQIRTNEEQLMTCTKSVSATPCSPKGLGAD